MSMEEAFFQSFNSRPHKEVDDAYREKESHIFHLSIHDLTRRSTIVGSAWEQC